MSYTGKKPGNVNTDFLEAGGELENHDELVVSATGEIAQSSVTALDTALAGKEPADATILKTADIGTSVLAPNGDASQLQNLPAGGLGGIEVFTTSGTWDWTAAGQPSKVWVTVIGGGGGGGSTTNDGTYRYYAAGGGGGGDTKFFEEVAVTGNVTVTVGAGGAGGAKYNNNGSAGGTSTFSTISAGGGAGGECSLSGRAIPAGGTGNGLGSNGERGGKVQFDGEDWWQHWGPAGGGAFMGGSGTNQRYGAGATDATGYGAGGAGANYDYRGGNGGAGVVIVYY